MNKLQMITLGKDIRSNEHFDSINFDIDGKDYVTWNLSTIKFQGGTLVMNLDHDEIALQQYNEMDSLMKEFIGHREINIKRNMNASISVIHLKDDKTCDKAEFCPIFVINEKRTVNSFDEFEKLCNKKSCKVTLVPGVLVEKEINRIKLVFRCTRIDLEDNIDQEISHEDDYIDENGQKEIDTENENAHKYFSNLVFDKDMLNYANKQHLDLYGTLNRILNDMKKNNRKFSQKTLDNIKSKQNQRHNLSQEMLDKAVNGGINLDYLQMMKGEIDDTDIVDILR